MAPRLIAIAGSTRTGSLNVALARDVVARAAELGFDAGFVDLGDHVMPLYDADLEATDGVPSTASVLAVELDAADVIVIASPEYNGAFTPLLKNAIDWVTRVDKTVFARATVGLAAATPGRLGGANGLAVLRAMLGHMRVPVADTTLTVPDAHAAFDDERLAAAEAIERRDALLAELLAATSVHGLERAAA